MVTAQQCEKKRAMQDSNPRLRLRRPEGYPDYPNRPIRPRWLPFFNELAQKVEPQKILPPLYDESKNTKNTIGIMKSASVM